MKKLKKHYILLDTQQNGNSKMLRWINGHEKYFNISKFKELFLGKYTNILDVEDFKANEDAIKNEHDDAIHYYVALDVLGFYE